jgi:DNA-directed RNA polymerase subunit K/omega
MATKPILEKKPEQSDDEESIQEEEETDNESIPAESDDDTEAEDDDLPEKDIESESEVESEAEEDDEDGVEGAEPLEEDGPDGVEGAEPLKTAKKTRAKRTVVSNIGLENLKTSKTVKPTYEDISDDDDEPEDVNYLQKFDNKMRENFILDHHPEARMHNYEEVKALCRVSRDARGIIIDPLHKTIPFLTKYEMTRVIGQRAKQLDSGAKAFVKIPVNVLDGYLIALLELEQKKLPFIIKRPYPNGGVEYWNVSDLEILL